MRNNQQNGKLWYTAILLISMLCIGVVADSCNTCKCGEALKYYATKKVDFLAYRKSIGPSPTYDLLADSAYLKDAELDLRLTFYFDYHSKRSEPWFSFFSSAQACDCAGDGHNGPDDKIESITLVTENGFNPNFSAGDTINGIVKIAGKDIPSFIQYWNQSKEQNYFPNKEITLSEKADIETWQRLKITMTFNTQTIISETQTFWIMP